MKAKKSFFAAVVLVFLNLVFSGSDATAAPKKEKYGKGVVRLSQDNSYLRKAAAPDYWALSSYLYEQRSNSSCSIAVVTTMLNAVRAAKDADKYDKLLSPLMILDKVGDQKWKDAVKTDGGGISVTELRDYVSETLDAFEIPYADVAVEFHQGAQDLPEFRADLVENEKSNKDFMILNFDQGFVMDDSPVGHFALVGAYNAVTDRVLVLDPDRKWFEPYWVPLIKLFDGMTGRGYIYVTLQ